MAITSISILETLKPALPFEILEKILIDVDDVPCTLRECALVTSTFRAIAQKRLFSTVKLIHYDQHIPYPPPNQIKFLNVLNSTPHLALHVQTLNIRYVQTGHLSPSVVFSEVKKPSNNVISLILPLLVNVRSISLAALPFHYWRTLCPSVRSALISAFHSPAITHLELANLDGVPLFTVLSGCKSLESLSLIGSSGYGTAWELPPSSLGPLHQQRPCLKSLQIQQFPFLDEFVAQLLDPHTSPVNVLHLQSLLVQGEPEGDHAGIVKLLDATHRTLIHLTLFQADDCFRDPVPNPAIPHLTRLSYLQRLDVRFMLQKPLESNNDTPPSHSWLSNLLATLPPKNELSELNIIIEVLSQSYIPDSDLRKWMYWAEFAFDPTSKRVSSLHLIQLMISSIDREHARNISLIFEEDEQLAPLRGRGVLCIKIIPPNEF